MKKVLYPLMVCIFMAIATTAKGEDGSNLWLRFDEQQNNNVTGVACVAMDELRQHWKGGAVVLKRQKKMSKDSYTISSRGGKTVIEGADNTALLYGAFHLLRLQQMGENVGNLSISEKPTYPLRILNHWDNPNGTVERGFAGRSIFLNPTPERMKIYARANASIGINGTVLNNVNAKPEALSTENLQKVKQIAEWMRPYGIKVYLSVNFASPMKLGGLETADPLNAQVVDWWKKKVAEIYKLIPDFGGFLVKANSEGEPGPCDFGRTHAEGANMMADILKKHGGIVMWRAFVYNPQSKDRARQAYEEFMPLDGQFHDNVILQVKNGPVDFQPREPYSPLFTSVKNTPTMVEFQITQEYLGAANHLVFLAPMWKEFLDYVKPERIKAMAGVANIGDDTNWCGHHFAQANWYAFGRLAWNPTLSSENIAKEWLKQTFTNDSRLVTPMTDVMTESREAAVNYMMPLGLHHIFAGGPHYGPEPWYDAPGIRRDWTPQYYHQADEKGLGFDRTLSGSKAVEQYPDALRDKFNNINTCPEEFLTWFHHVAWAYKMKSGRTFWDELCHKYEQGVHEARAFLATWDAMQPYVDQQRFEEVQRKLRIQARDAVWWRDACLLYFQQFSKRPIPADMEHPVHNLDEMMRYKINITMYENPEYGYDR